MSTNPLHQNIENYCERHSSEHNDVLAELEKYTAEHHRLPQMVSGHLQGLFLQQCSMMLKPKRILELGTFTGYATICLAKGLEKEGEIFTVDVNEDLKKTNQLFFKKAGIQTQVKQFFGPALEILPQFKDLKFDLIFIDADKINTLRYYKICLDLLAEGGSILVDNVLWYGKVDEPIKASDSETVAIDAFNKYVKEDPSVEHFLLPLRDGIMMIRKKLE